MAKNRIIYALLAVICVAFSMLYRSNFSAVLLIAVLAYLPLAAIFTLASLFLADVRFLHSNYIGEKNTSFEFDLEIKNRFIMPFVPLEVLSYIPDGEKGVFNERRIFVTLQPFGNTILIINGMHKYSGQYKSQIKKIYTVDPLRIIRFSRRINREMTLVFLPRRFVLEDLFENTEGEANVSRTTAKRAEKEDFSHVRDYREGDILQLVHWKLTAKSDDIMIKEYESISDRKARIVCDFNRCREKRDVLLNFDTIVETALAFARSLLNENIGATVDFGDILRNDLITVKNPTDYEKLYELMSTLSADSEFYELDSMFGEIRTDEQSIIVLITAELSEETVALANYAAGFSTVVIAFVNIENAPLARDYSEEKFDLMNIRGAGKDALESSAMHLREKP